MNKVRHYCVNCRENGEEDDNVIFDMSGYWDIESQSWVPSDLPTIEEYCGTCGSESTDTEEVPDHTPDPRVRTCPRCKDTDFDSATDLIEHVRECYRASWQVQYHTPDPMESPSEGVLMDYRHEIHDYLVEKGEREE